MARSFNFGATMWRAMMVAGIGFTPLIGADPGVAQESPAHITATMRGGAVTLSAAEASLREVLTEFGRASGIATYLETGMAAGESTTIDLDRVPPEEGFRRLLRTKNFVFVYSGDALAEVRAYTPARQEVSPRPAAGVPAAAVPAADPVPEDERQEGLRLRAQALGNPDPDERAMGIWELATTENHQLARETAVELLEKERVADVLQSALMVLGRMDPLPLEPILAFVSANRVSDSAVRIQALELMADRGPADPRVKQLLVGLASADRDADVRESAQQLLETLVEH